MFNTKAIKATILFTAVCVFGWIAHGVQTLAQIEITNEVYTAAQTDAKIVELAPAPGNYAIVSNRAMMAIQGVEYVYGVDVAITNYPNGVGFDFRNGIMFDFSEGGSGIPYYAYLRPERGHYNTAFSWLLPISEDYDGLDDILLASQEDIAVAANSATNYTDAAIAKLSGMLSITGEVKPLSSQYADSAQSALFLQGDETLYSPYNLMRESTNAALAVTLAFSNNVYRSLSSKQDALPYPTNAIPYSVLTNIPTIRSDMITDGTNTLSANLDYEYEKVLTNTWVVNGIPYTTTTGYTYCSYFPPNPNENDMGYTLTLNEGSSWEFGYYDLSIGAWYWRNQGTEEDPDYQWVSDSGGMTGLLPANGTSFNIDGFVGTYPIKRMETSKLVLTNDIPPAVQVVTPSTKAVKGTAADAKATGIALYTGYTTWEPYGENPGYKLISVEYNSGSWKVVYIVDGDSNVYTNTTSGAGDETDLIFHSELNSITRHLVTPTKTSQLINDSSFVTTNNSGTIETSIGIYGSLKNGTNVVATGIFSHAEGGSTTAEGNYAHSEGNGTYARGLASHSEGLFTRATERASHSSGACALATNSWSFVWSGLERSPYYGSHGVSSFNVNPINGINGFYIGEQTLQQAIVASIMDTSLSNDIEVVYQNQDNADAAMISDIVVTQAVTNHVPTIRTAVRDVVDNAIGNGMVNVTNHYSDWFFTGLPSGVTVTSLQYRNNQWAIQLSNGDHQSMNGNGDNSTSLLFLSSDWMESTGTGDVTADRFFQLQDRSMNILTTWGLTVPLSFPKPVPNKFREFRLRLVITAQPSSADYLNLHGAITNGVEETISFETDDGTFPSVTTISTNLYHFVETAPSIFYVEKKQLTPAPLF